MPIRAILRISVVVIIIAISILCSNGGAMSQGRNNEFKNIDDAPTSAWERLSKQKIYFGHQSVGNNIIEGLKKIEEQYPQIRLDIIRIQKPNRLENPGLYHSEIGKNDYPKTKIDAFVQAMQQGIGQTADIAFFKFCFVDITGETNIEELFDYYSKTMEKLRKEYPSVTFVHFTVPLLRRNKPSLKSYIRKIFGRADGFFADGHNIARNKFNELIMETYAGKEPIFDLAVVESTYQDGRRCSFSDNGNTYYSLVPEYTNDGGHLNELGQRVVAEQLLMFLASMGK